MSVTFEYNVPARLTLTIPQLRKTLKDVQEQLLTRGINGGARNLDMDRICSGENTCGTAACIGGWASLFLLGFDKTKATADQVAIVEDLFDALIKLDTDEGNGMLARLFYAFSCTESYNTPNIAATAIKRYLAGQNPWPNGPMPNVLPYTAKPKKAAVKKAAVKKAAVKKSK